MKSKIITITLALLLGGIGAHRFYLGEKEKGIVYILLCATLYSRFLGFVDALCFLVMSNNTFHARYSIKPPEDLKTK